MPSAYVEQYESVQYGQRRVRGTRAVLCETQVRLPVDTPSQPSSSETAAEENEYRTSGLLRITVRKREGRFVIGMGGVRPQKS